MLKSALKYSGIVVAVVLFLTITINEKTLFHYVYGVISPATKATQQLTSNLVAAAYKQTHSYTRKLFVNSVPTVRAKANQTAEFIHEEEKQQLDDLIKTHR